VTAVGLISKLAQNGKNKATLDLRRLGPLAPGASRCTSHHAECRPERLTALLQAVTAISH